MNSPKYSIYTGEENLMKNFTPNLLLNHLSGNPH